MKKMELQSIPYRKLFRYADTTDCLLLTIGTIAAVAHGAALPLMFVYLGKLTTEFVTYGRYTLCGLDYNTCLSMNLTTLNYSYWNATLQPQLHDFRENAIFFTQSFAFIACAVFVLGLIQVSTWSLQALRQTKLLRAAYFYSVIRQDIGFHDVTSSGELNARLSNDIRYVGNGIGDKVSLVIQNLSIALGGVVVGFVYTWKLTLVALTITPLLGLSSVLLLKVSDNSTQRELDAYAKAGSIAEETLYAIRTVVAFGCQDKEAKRYASHLENAKQVGLRRGIMSGFSVGLLYLSIFAMYGLCFWYGTTLILAGEITIGDLTTCFFSILLGSFSLGTVSSYLGIFSEAKAAGKKIFEIIDKVPEIDIFSKEGEEPNEDSGEINFVNVHFSYPSRPNVKVLNGVSLKVNHGKTVAFVGQSGSGKSTIMQLVQRFYDVQSGYIEIGGKKLKSLNLKQHRNLIGVVAQEPVLFATTISENIRWGREGVTNKEIQEAAKKANAYNFIMKLPKQFETVVGEGGGQMSGGQKQRIAIARAIVRNPKILLLDEATSALDTRNETLVQTALERASVGRTTIVIAHRLSTIRNANKIIAFEDGEVKEQGTHDELLQITNGVYKNLVNMQTEKENREEPSSVVNENNTYNTSGMFEEQEDVADVSVVNGNSFRSSLRSSRRKRRLSSSSIFRRQYSIGLVSTVTDVSRRSSRVSVADSVVEDISLEVKDGTVIEENLPEFSFLQILKLNKPEWAYMAGGCICSAIAGSIDPINAIVFAEVLKIFTLSDPEEQNSQAIFYGVLFLVSGIVAFLAYLFEASLFTKSGVELTKRLRNKAFSVMLRQHIAFFDESVNSIGALTTILAADASRVKGCSGVRIGTIVKNFTSLGVALGIAFAYGWKISLVVLGFIPLIVLGGFIEIRLLTGSEEYEKMGYDVAGLISVEAVNNIRTMASLTREQCVYDLYVSKLASSFKKTSRKAFLIGAGYGFSQCIIFFVYCAAFRLGVDLVITGESSFDNVYKVLAAVVFGALAIGQNSSLAPDYAEAKVSASRMFALLDQCSVIDVYSKDGQLPTHCKGEIEMKSAFFHYPSRPNVPVLRGCDIYIKPGQTLALVGPSGCGKSTIVQLLERFYDPSEGQVLLDGINICKLNTSWLRQQIGLVSQEPILFDQSLKENILYGDCTRVASDEEIETAAKASNIHDFIISLPNGYSTKVGSKGNQLSGGQKQRVAIARALLRNPKILLLDEATSALDTESEQIVQKALDTAREGRTCIVVAHRLSTVKTADQIAVIESGVVVELGTHSELIAKKGAYFSLVNTQLSVQDRSENCSHSKDPKT